MLALEQVHIGRAEEDGRAIIVGLSHGTGSFVRLEQHHIASNVCQWENLRRHHVGDLHGTDSMSQIDSSFEERKAALHIPLLTRTFLR